MKTTLATAYWALMVACLTLASCTEQPEAPSFVLSPDGVPIHFEIHGTGNPALVFVHGWSCDRTYWNVQVPAFSGDHQVVLIDLAGHGESGDGRDVWSMEAFGQDVAAVVNELGLNQVVLIGHSMGGPVVVEAARQMGSRVLGIVGVDFFKDYGTTYSEEQIEAIFEPFRADFIGTTKVWVRENGFLRTSDPELVEWVAEDMAAGPPVVGLEAGAEMWRWLGEPSRTAFRDLQVPGILINSDLGNTDVAAIREYASAPFDAVLMSGVGHFVMMEDPETFNALLSEAIAGFLH